MPTKYEILLHTPLGERQGSLLLQEENGHVSGTLSLMGFDNPVSGICRDGTVTLEHRLHTLVSDLECRTELRPAEGTIRSAVRTGTIRSQFRGSIISQEKESDAHGTESRS